MAGKAALLFGLMMTRMPEGLARIWLAGRRTRMGDRLLDPKAQLVGEFVNSIRVPGHIPSVEEARGQLKKMAELMDSPAPALARMENKFIPGPAGEMPARLYSPVAHGEADLPVLMFMHGGGFVQGDLDTHDAPCAKLARDAHCLVIALDYRLAPEHKFPAAVDDCIAAYKWLSDNVADWGGDAARIALAGDSAGGNLSAVICQQIKGGNVPMPAAQVLIYPATDFNADTPSHEELADGFIIPRDRMLWYTEQYLNGDGDKDDPRASPLLAKDFSGLAPAMVITGGFDPLRDEGRAYADKLSAAGVPIVYREWPGQIHAFISLTKMIPQGDACLREIADYLVSAFAAAAVDQSRQAAE